MATSKISIFSKYWNYEQSFEIIFSPKTVSIEKYIIFSYPITFTWLWNTDIETKGYKKTKDSRDEIFEI
jgi:hypothetical protein